MNRRERTLVMATMIAGLAAALVWGYARLVDAKDAAATSARNLAECERLAGRIESERGTPAPVATAAATARGAGGGVQPADVSRRIEAAAEVAELPEDSIERIEPGLPRRLGDGPFLERPTTVELRGVALDQLFTFLHALAAEEGAPLGLKTLRLAAPPGAAGPVDEWNVESTLTQTTYAPKDPAARRASAASSR